MLSICLIGSGNVATHLAKAFVALDGITLLQVYSRSGAGPENVDVISDLNAIKDADLYIIAVSDDAIAEVSAALPFEGRLVAHTSGTMPLDILDGKNRRAVFYPLQTFSKAKAVDFKKVPVCLEAEYPADRSVLEKVAHAVSDAVYGIDSAQRKALHVAAVFASNFVNDLYRNAFAICEENGISPDILKPLIVETADKILALPPKAAQTGPAKRHDEKTIAAHLAWLEGSGREKIYELLTQSIQNGQKL